MATSAPFGTDLQPLHTVKIVGSKVVYLSSVESQKKRQLPLHRHGVKNDTAAVVVGDDDIVAMVHQSFATVLNKRQCLANILSGCTRLDEKRSGYLEASTVAQVLFSYGVYMTESDVALLARAAAGNRGISVSYRQLCELFSHALNGTMDFTRWKKLREAAHSAYPHSSSENKSTCHVTSSAGDQPRNQLSGNMGAVDCSSDASEVLQVARNPPLQFSSRASRSCPPDYFINAADNIQAFPNDYFLQRPFTDARMPSLVPKENWRHCAGIERNSLQDGVDNLIKALHQCSSLSGVTMYGLIPVSVTVI